MEGGIYMSTSVFDGLGLDGLLDLCGRRGITNIELGSGVQYSEGMAETAVSRRGEFRFLLHNYFPPAREPFVLNLGAEDEGLLEKSREHCRIAIDLTARLGGGFYSVHAGFAFRARPELLNREGADYELVPMEKAKRSLIESLISLAAYAEARDVGLLVENNVVSAANLIDGKNLLGLGVSGEELLEIVEDVCSPALGLLIDVGHLKVSGASLGFDPAGAIEKVGGHIRAFHLSDNDGSSDQHLPFDDGAWFLPVLKEFRGATKIIEARCPEDGQLERCMELADKRG